MTKNMMTGRSIRDLGQALREGAVTAHAIAEQVMANYQRFDQSLNAFKSWMPDKIEANAQAADAAFDAGFDLGALQGLPVSVKDLYGVPGYPTFAGTPKELPEKWQAQGPVVERLRANLAVITGKTHTVEFAFGGVGTNPHWGTPINPWGADQHHVPGGSSAGAGVSLMAGTALVAMGSDTAGSVRCPASITGTVGVKTSYGRWPLAGIVPLSPSLDTAGILTRTAEDAAIAFAEIDSLTTMAPLAFAELAGACAADEFSIAVLDWFFDDCDDDIAACTREALGALERAGAGLTSIELPEAVRAHEMFLAGGLAAPEFAAFITGEMADWRDTLDPNVASRFARMEAITAVEYLHRASELEALTRAVHARLEDHDLVVGPTVPISPPEVAALDEADAYRKANLTILRNTAPGNLLGLCAVTIPIGLDSHGMPVGLQIIGAGGEDERVIAAACAFERVLGTARQRLGTPPRCAD
ncbi:MAG: amidase [Rhizobiales bacterium]|nr:amidase [Hyphomicrobiales bacterium]